MREHRELVAGAEYVINEGGTIRIGAARRITYHGIGVTEKSPFWLTITARGTAGHGSRPIPDNAVARLIAALGRIEAWRRPLTVVPTMDLHFKAMSQITTDPKLRTWYQDIRSALDDPEAVRRVTSNLSYSALLQNTISITGLRGSDKTNVIPPVASATLDVRLLPGQDPDVFLANLRRIVHDSQIEFTPQGVNWPATESDIDTELYHVIEDVTQRLDGHDIVVPTMLAGFTDSHHFRRLGITAYGISPFPLSADEARGVHGNDERLPLSALRYGLEYLFEVAYGIAGR